ncbi:hypothetical protein FDF12_09880 [Clostridium botulinum]|nr:hypothetical protein [Clostridium botulinum]NFS55194.1 hypothetical protein [Clostridium botulinum]NFT17681.1 hypothetical protein [Clostridium botulinum]
MKKKFSTFVRDASLEFGEKVLGLNYDQCAIDSKSNRKLRDVYAEDDRRDAEDYDKLREKAPNKDVFDNVSKVTSGSLILIDTVIAGYGLINIARSGISLAKFSGKAQNILKFGDKIANKTKNTVNTIEKLNRLKNTNGVNKTELEIKSLYPRGDKLQYDIFIKQDEIALNTYTKLRETGLNVNELKIFSENTGLSIDTATKLKEHVILTEHQNLLNNETRTYFSDYFQPDLNIAYGWEKALKGELNAAEKAWFKQLAEHELAESELMKQNN